jgi:hypothetical protein
MGPARVVDTAGADRRALVVGGGRIAQQLATLYRHDDMSARTHVRALNAVKTGRISVAVTT